jgi:parallel beta-helix repeat protein
MRSRGLVVQNNYGVTIIVLLLAILMLPFTVEPTIVPSPADSGDGDGHSSPGPHATDPPIVIDSDADLASQATANGWPGNGTAGHPYVISEKNINGTEASNCIYIGNVSSPLLIKDNHLVNASRHRAGYFPKIAGVHIFQSTNVTVRSNLIENITGVPDENWFGIYVRDSSAVVEDNTIKRVTNGIVGGYSHVSVTRNTIESVKENGIDIAAGVTGSIENNTISGSPSDMTWYGATIGSNLPVLVANNSVVWAYNGFRIYNPNVTVVDNNITDCRRGMGIGHSEGSLFLNNTMRCTDVGIWLHENENLTFRKNTFYGPGFAINQNYCWPYLDKQDIDTSNNVDGLPILYITHERDRVISGNWGQVIISHCDNITVTGMDIRSGFAGFLCGNTPNLTIRENVIRSPYKGEVRIYPGEYFLVSNNTFENISIDVGGRQYQASIHEPGTIDWNHLVNGFIRNWYVANVTISNNTVVSDYFRGIDANGVRDMTIEDNDVTIVDPRSGSSGIHIGTEGVTRVNRNSLHNNGFEIWGDENQMRAFEFGDDNTLGGKPVIYRKDTVSQTFDDKYSQIILVGCTDFTIDGFNPTTGNIGLTLGYCQDGIVRNSTFDGPSYTSIYSQGCNGIQVTGCTFIEGHLSIRSEYDGNLTIKDNWFQGTEYHTIAAIYGDNILIEGNILLDCQWRGIYLLTDTEGSRIISNYIGNNTEHAIQASGPIDIWYNTFVDNAINSTYGEGQISGGDSWDDGARGNYWSDYEEIYPNATNNGVTWDTPYAPNGPRSLQDRHPLVHAWDIFPPVARAHNITVYEGQSFLLNGSLCTDNIGIVEYVWTFPDINSPIHLIGKVVPYTIHEPGVYNVTLTVEDSGGLTDSIPIVVTVLPNHLPIAVAGENVTVDQHTTVTFNGSLSTDDVGIGEWYWSFIYEGENVMMTGEEVNFTFHVPGAYTVHLRVTDMLGKRGYDNMTVTVLDTEPPIISTVTEIEARLGVEVVFDAHFSIDNVGIAEYNWSWEYDGSTHTSSGAIIHFTFDIPSTYQVALRITDTAGNSNTTTVTVVVVDLSAPMFGPYGGMIEVVVDTMEIVVRFNWTLWSDDDARFPRGANFTYSLTKDGETYVGHGKYANITLPSGGTYDAIFSAIDASGNEATHAAKLVIEWLPEDASLPVANAGDDVVVYVMDTIDLKGSYVLGDLALEVWGWTTPDDPGELLLGLNHTFTADAVGEFTYRFWVSDWMANGANDSVVVKVLPRTPEVSIATDLSTPIAKDLDVFGAASGDVDIQRVEYRVDGGEWELADGSTVWSFTIHVSDLSNDEHTLEVRVWDGYGNGTTGPVPFIVDKPPDDEGNGGSGLWLFIVVGVVAVVVAVVLYIKRRNGQE